jgi:hypothetical protein
MGSISTHSIKIALENSSIDVSKHHALPADNQTAPNRVSSIGSYESGITKDYQRNPEIAVR